MTLSNWTSDAVSEQHYKQLFSQAPAPIAIYSGRELRYVFVNEAYSKIFNGRNILNKTIREAFPELEGQGYYEILEGVFDTGVPYHGNETPALIDVANNGQLSTRYYNLVYTPFKNEAGVIEGVMAFGHDVTNQVEARQKVEEAKDGLNYRNALFEAQNETTPDGNLIVDAKGKILSYNRQFIKIWNIPQAIMDANDDEAALQYAMTQVADPEGFINWVLYLYAHPEEKSHEEILFKDGRIIERYGTSVIGKDGTYYAWAWYFRDITKDKKNKEALDYQNMLVKTITDNATSALFMMNAKGYCTFMNTAGEKMFGYTQAEIREKPLHYLIHHHRPDGSFYPMDECPIDRALPENFDVRAHHDLFFRKDGSSFHVTCAASPIFEDGIPVSTVIEVRDLTLEIKAEQTLRRSAEELEQLVVDRTMDLKKANEQLQQFSYAASHDLQEPLRKVSFFLERLLSRVGPVLDEENKKTANQILRTVERMRGLIYDLLDYSNATLGITAFDTIDLNTLIGEVLSDMEATIIEKKVQLEIPRLPLINGDKRQLRQLFQNLLSNAFKYQKPGNVPRVRIAHAIRTGNEAPIAVPSDKREKQYHAITVSDNGIGFTQENVEKIFEIFQRLHGKSEFEGTGVGLAIVRRVAENHGGFIWAESRPEEGAVFTVLLPVD